MRPGKKGRSVARVLVAVAIATAAVVTAVVLGVVPAAADVQWTFVTGP